MIKVLFDKYDALESIPNPAFAAQTSSFDNLSLGLLWWLNSVDTDLNSYSIISLLFKTRQLVQDLGYEPSQNNSYYDSTFQGPNS